MTPAMILVLLTALMIPVSAQAQVGKDLMLRVLQVKTTAGDVGSPDSRSYDEALVYRDGLVLFVSNRDDGSARSVRGQVGEAALESLKTLLVEDRVDQQQGRCTLTGVGGLLEGSEVVSDRQSLLSWYGVRSRRVRQLPMGHAEAASGQFVDDCSPRLTRIYQATLDMTEEALTAPSSTGDPDSNYPISLLLEVRNGLEEDPSCGDGGFVDDFHLFRDGLLVRRFQNADGDYLISRATVPAGLRQRLNQTLTEEQIASLSGACRTWFFIPFVVEGGCLDYAWKSSAEWMGRNGRRGVVEGNEGAEATCTEGKTRIRHQLMGVILNALSFDTVESVQGELPRVFVPTPRP